MSDGEGEDEEVFVRAHHPDYGEGRHLGDAPKSYSRPHVVVWFDDGLIRRVLKDEVTVIEEEA